jgi:multidrug efflux pump subunit AcrA (membrane-fusion protein)
LGALVIASAEVRARRRAVLASPEGGTIRRLEVREGDRVVEGQPLIYLQGQRRRTQVDAEVARLEQARARFHQAQSLLKSTRAQAQRKQEQARQGVLQARISIDQNRREVDAAYRDWKRKAQLLEERSIAKVEVEAAELQWKIKQDELRQALSRETEARSTLGGARDSLSHLGSQQAQVDEAQAAVAEAEANLRLAQEEETETVLRAPISGMLINLRAVAGQSVGSDVLGLIVDTGDLEVIATLDPAQASGLGPEASASLHSPLLERKSQSLGFVDIIPAIEGQSNTIRARFRFLERPERHLVDGLQAQVHLTLPPRSGWLIPRDALREEQSRSNSVRLLRNGGEVPIEVTVLGTDSNYALCEGDLHAGDQVVIAGGQ